MITVLNLLMNDMLVLHLIIEVNKICFFFANMESIRSDTENELLEKTTGMSRSPIVAFVNSYYKRRKEILCIINIV